MQSVYEWTVEGSPIRYLTPNDVADWRAKTLLSKEPETIEWLLGFEPGSHFLDIGANVGMYSIFAAGVRHCEVTAFEPESQNYATLNGNINLNDLSTRVRAYCAGLSDHDGLDLLHLSRFYLGDSGHSLGENVDERLRPRADGFRQGCVSFRLDTLVERGAIAIPRYIKIDVDGLEHRIIAGARQTLRRPEVREIQVELNPRLPEHLDIIEVLCDEGFDYDPGQVERATRKEGTFEGMAEYVFKR